LHDEALNRNTVIDQLALPIDDALGIG